MGTGTFARFSCTSERTHEGAIHGIVCCGKVVHATGVEKDCFAIENKGDGTAIAWSVIATKKIPWTSNLKLEYEIYFLIPYLS